MSEIGPSCSSCETRSLGGEVSPAPREAKEGALAFRVRGMDCAEEVAILKGALADLVPEEALSFDVLTGRMTVRVPVDEARILAAVAATGMRAERWAEGSSRDAEVGRNRRRDGLVAASLLATLAGFSAHVALDGLSAAVGSEGLGLAAGIPWPIRALYFVAILSGLWVVLPKAWYALRSLRPDMNLLMVIAVVGAVAIGEWLEAATVSSLFALSLALEAWSVGRARRAVEALMRLAPDTVRVRGEDGSEREVDPADVPVGTPFTVLPGERIGLDGRVTSGRTEVDQAPITGESQPVEKQPGDLVFAGTINGSGAIEVLSTHPAGETTLARIVRQVSDSQGNRSVSERFVERFARVYTPVVFASAVLVALVPPFFWGEPWAPWTYRALVLLVIGCPCALVISTPVAIVASLASAARHGVLLKGGRVAELPARLAAVALDKTGTLTYGEPTVVELVPLGEHDERALLARAAGLERRSTHPLAAAILRRAEEVGVEPIVATDVTVVPGRGVEGRIEGRSFRLGSHRWLEECGSWQPELAERLQALSAAGRSVVVVGNDEHVCGMLAVADAVRPESRRALDALRGAGVRAVVMLTGDNDATAQAVAREVGVDQVHSELLPEDKVAVIEEVEEAIGPVAMVGDGVNDAPALARATLGVAMGAIGTDVALETADVALMSDDLSKLAWLIEHARATLSVIRWNTAIALGIKAVFVVLTFAGLATLWGAVAADMGASLLVVANSLRLLRR